ncbi:MAG: hypothetical protein U0169_07590 [Polyangiaceae bacterium]
MGPGRGGELTMRLRYRSDGPRETAAETLREVVRASRRPAARTLVTALLADADVDEDAKAKQVVVRRQVPTAVLSRLALDAASLLAPGATAPPTGTDAGAPPERVDAGAYFPRKTPLLQLGPFDGGIRME